MIRITLILLALGNLGATLFSAPIKPQPPEHLIIGLDGVSYFTFMKLYEGGYFQYLNRPIPMVATFPTISDPNWNQMMGTDVQESYTKVHFDLNTDTEDGKGAPVGNLLTNLKTEVNYYKAFDFKPENAFEQLTIFGWTETTGEYAVDSLIQYFLKSRKKESYKAFILNTDIIAHMGGEEPLMKFLGYLDNRIKHLRKTYKGKYKKDLQITLISDHGNSFVEPHFVEYQSMLLKKKWKLVESLKEKRDVAVVIPEILSFAAFYVHDDFKQALAKDLSELKGVHTVAYSKSEKKLNLFIQNYGQLKVLLSPKERTLTFLSSPPKNFGQFQAKKTYTWDEYFRKSLNAKYPYAVVNLWEGFYVNAKQGASVLVSTDIKWAFANPTLKVVSKIKGKVKSLHGSLDRLQSFGIVATSKKLTFEGARPSDVYQSIILQQP